MYQQLQKREAVADELDAMQSATAVLGQLFLESGCVMSLQISHQGVFTLSLIPSGLYFAQVYTEVNCLPV